MTKQEMNEYLQDARKSGSIGNATVSDTKKRPKVGQNVPF